MQVQMTEDSYHFMPLTYIWPIYDLRCLLNNVFFLKLCKLLKLTCLLASRKCFQITVLSQNSIKNTLKVSNHLGSRSGPKFCQLRPDLGPNSLLDQHTTQVKCWHCIGLNVLYWWLFVYNVSALNRRPHALFDRLFLVVLYGFTYFLLNAYDTFLVLFYHINIVLFDLILYVTSTIFQF